MEDDVSLIPYPGYHIDRYIFLFTAALPVILVTWVGGGVEVMVNMFTWHIGQVISSNLTESQCIGYGRKDASQSDYTTRYCDDRHVDTIPRRNLN